MILERRKEMKFLTSEKVKHYLLCAGAAALHFAVVAALFALALGLDLKNLTWV
jgi:hypothetical protein